MGEGGPCLASEMHALQVLRTLVSALECMPRLAAGGRLFLPFGVLS